MNKELRKLLDKINAKKTEVRNYVNEGKTAEAVTAKEELKELQQQFDILLDIDDDDKRMMQNRAAAGAAKVVDNNIKFKKEDVVRAFVNRIVCGLRRTTLGEEDTKIMNAMSETSDEDGGFTVPKDIRTDIIELRRSDDDLEQYVNIEKTTTESGSRVIEKDADSTPWEDVDEGEEFPEDSTPQFALVKYKIKKRGGVMKMTRELLQDTAENILGSLNKWIAKKSRATRNFVILKALGEITKGKEVAVTTFDDLKKIVNVTLDPAIARSAMVFTNQSGFNYLDTLKDEKGEYIMQPDVTDKTKTLLFGVYEVKKISNKVLKDEQVMNSDGHTIDAEKYPVYIGNFKEAITLFDREKITLELSTEAGDLWAKDLTGAKVRDRFDVQKVDEAAVVKGIITVRHAG